ncbi:hypothetical protein SAMN05421762_2703 [Pseudooceanicola nitratireducens]|uniref:Transposase n=1 Tax=Pseudooceanicola nitratireducens TaxID=517719 RepID=A0A1I1N816_9RHOB|nr:hypothetical protein SAMN05216183_101635 [Pseudooceanicola nitratireducens]SFC90923.1 hypothetical protein SAMN05421762_2703 [Pseudooceanicola nitratireducens]
MAEHRGQFSIRAMCRCLRIQPSGFYAWLKAPLSRRAQEDKRQTEMLKEAWVDSGKVYGHPLPGRRMQSMLPRSRCDHRNEALSIAAPELRRFGTPTGTSSSGPSPTSPFLLQVRQRKPRHPATSLQRDASASPSPCAEPGHRVSQRRGFHLNETLWIWPHPIRSLCAAPIVGPSRVFRSRLATDTSTLRVARYCPPASGQSSGRNSPEAY